MARQTVTDTSVEADAIDPGVKAAADAAIAAATAEPGLTWEVRGPEGGRRRAGRRFTPQPLTIPVGDLTLAERELILSDPALSVREVKAA